MILWLYIDVGSSIVGIAAGGSSIAAYSKADPDTPLGFSDSLPGAEEAEMVYGLTGLLQVVVTLVTGILILKWIYRTDRNAHSLAPGLTIRPPWAVGWFFVPFANLMMPFRALREAWQVSAKPEAWNGVPAPGLLRWWWGLWLVYNIIGNVAFRLSFQAKTVGETVVSTDFDLFHDLVGIPLDLVFILVVRRLSTMQADALRGRVFA